MVNTGRRGMLDGDERRDTRVASCGWRSLCVPRSVRCLGEDATRDGSREEATREKGKVEVVRMRPWIGES